MTTQKYWEDMAPGLYELGTVGLGEDEIIAFARQFDPQPFHTDPAAAQSSIFGGLVASGWHTCALAMRQLVDHFLVDYHSLGSPGVEKIRWIRPVRPGGTLTVSVTVREKRASRSRPDVGMVTYAVEVLNQRHEPVAGFDALGMVRRRPA